MIDLAASGHGWVFPHPQGIKARCGGPGMCAQCRRDAMLKDLATLTRRALRSVPANDPLRVQGVALLKEYGLAGSPIRLMEGV